MVLVVYDESGNRMEFDTWQELQEFFDNLEKEKIKKNLKDNKTYHVVKCSEPVRVEFE